jgi:hypothetical protein
MTVRTIAGCFAIALLAAGCSAQQSSAPAETHIAQQDLARVESAANRAEDAAKRAEVAAEKAEVIFHKSLQK